MIKTWLTFIDLKESEIKKIVASLKPYGFEIDGHQFQSDLKTFGFMEARDAIFRHNPSMWCIVAPKDAFSNHDTAYGLSMLAFSIRAEKGYGFPLVILLADHDSLDPETLPTALSGAKIFSLKEQTVGAKLIALGHTQVKNIPWEYYIDIHGSEQLGQWLEIRPVQLNWKGIIFGLDDGEIIFQAVGKSGKLPEKSILDYPSKGLKLVLNEKNFLAWALQNEIDANHSYYVKISGYPKTILFGPYSDEESSDVFVVRLVP